MIRLIGFALFTIGSAVVGEVAGVLHLSFWTTLTFGFCWGVMVACVVAALDD